ncbi:nucleoside hydrolase [Azospirillum thermophilum]|uniref:Nucleoside hydrolase n=1 Tax=Azospirillum thermophilum TaxID=2202148 RepID=A0A2S2CVZ4_9PROT|nr:nucleoside hydrolase [Azospirillum thermophilum]AWK88570.1 nucleoside hydrolase [Azospirillum thermophilum]
MRPPPRRLVIDTDPGVDDALAILLALASPEVEVVGLTTVFGNASVELTTRNARAVLAAAGRTDVPVATGAAAPLAGAYAGPVPQVHGADGLGDGGLGFPQEPALASTVAAAEFLWRSAQGHPGELTILALGPLTNLALALRLHPDLPRHVAGVVIMGGNALVPGNANPCAEANMLGDPEAGDVVLGAPWPVTMVGLDVTHKAVLPGAAIARVTAPDRPANRLLAAALPHYRNFFERTNGIDGIYLHDPSAVAYVVAPHLFTTAGWPVRVETQGMSRGKTWPCLGDTDDPAPAAWQGRPTVRVAVGVEGDQVAALVEDRLSA